MSLLHNTFPNQTAIVMGHQVKVTTYPLGQEFVYMIENLATRATLWRAKGRTEEIAIKRALVEVARRFRQAMTPIDTSRRPRIAMVQYEDLSGIVRLRPDEFRNLEIEEWTDIVLNHSLCFFDSIGLSVSIDDALPMLLE